jgi:hypothetical protein
MLYSTDRNLATNAGALPRPADPGEMVLAATVGHGVGYVAAD